MTEIKTNLVSTSQDNSAASPKVVKKTVAKERQEADAALEEEYIDERKITIATVNSYSAYRKVNVLAMGKPTMVIGSSVNSVKKLMSNKGELEAYFPELVGLSPNNPDFVTRVKAYLNNIQVIVPDELELDITFVYKHKYDYLAVKAKEEAIYNEYDRVDRSDVEALYRAAVKRDEDLNRLETTKYKMGYPLNIPQYVIYRHCLFYPEVAKDTAFINSNSTLRFYIKDKNKELVRQSKLVNEKKLAMRNLVELGSSKTKTTAVYVAIASYKHLNIAEALNKPSSQIDTELMAFVDENPAKFNKFVNDKFIETKCFIETLIARGELVRSELNQQISLPDGQYIGANMNEAVSFFSNPNNAGLKTQLENKMKLL